MRGKKLFGKIHEQWQREREKKDLEKIDLSFYGAVRDFLKLNEDKVLGEKNELRKKIYEARLKRIKFVIEDLAEIRTRKIFELLIQQKEPEKNLASEERDFFERQQKIYNYYLKELHEPEEVAFIDIDDLVEIKNTEKQKIEEEQIDYVVVKIKQNIEQPLMGLDGQKYGPFQKEDVCVLPKINAIGLVKRKVAEEIEIKD